MRTIAPIELGRFRSVMIDFSRLRSEALLIFRLIPPPCEVLGISPDTPLPEARKRWRDLVRESHPDRAIARGLPPEAIPAGGAAGSAAYLVGVFGPAFIEVLLARLRHAGKGDGDA